MLFFKGIIIGIGKILPGVSGSLIAITMNIYAPLLESISTINKNTYEKVKFLFPILSGILTSIILFSNIIEFFIKRYYFSILLLFIGLIIGSIDLKQIKIKNNTIPKMIIFTLSITLVLLIEKLTLSITIPNNFLIYIVLGIIEALSTIIPGISGTSLFMTLGKYEQIIEAFAHPLNNIPFLIPFFIGVIICVIIISKLITKILKKHEELFFASSLGFTIATLITMYIKTFTINKNIPSIIIGEILLVLGYILSKKMNKL